MKKGQAVNLAVKMTSETKEPHYVVWEPNSLKETITASGYRVKSETEMIIDYGSVENFYPNIVSFTF